MNLGPSLFMGGALNLSLEANPCIESGPNKFQFVELSQTGLSVQAGWVFSRGHFPSSPPSLQVKAEREMGFWSNIQPLKYNIRLRSKILINFLYHIDNFLLGEWKMQNLIMMYKRQFENINNEEGKSLLPSLEIFTFYFYY